MRIPYSLSTMGHLLFNFLCVVCYPIIKWTVPLELRILVEGYGKMISMLCWLMFGVVRAVWYSHTTGNNNHLPASPPLVTWDLSQGRGWFLYFFQINGRHLCGPLFWDKIIHIRLHTYVLVLVILGTEKANFWTRIEPYKEKGFKEFEPHVILGRCFAFCGLVQVRTYVVPAFLPVAGDVQHRHFSFSQVCLS